MLIKEKKPLAEDVESNYTKYSEGSLTNGLSQVIGGVVAGREWGPVEMSHFS